MFCSSPLVSIHHHLWFLPTVLFLEAATPHFHLRQIGITDHYDQRKYVVKICASFKNILGLQSRKQAPKHIVWDSNPISCSSVVPPASRCGKSGDESRRTSTQTSSPSSSSPGWSPGELLPPQVAGGLQHPEHSGRGTDTPTAGTKWSRRTPLCVGMYVCV